MPTVRLIARARRPAVIARERPGITGPRATAMARGGAPQGDPAWSRENSRVNGEAAGTGGWDRATRRRAGATPVGGGRWEEAGGRRPVGGGRGAREAAHGPSRSALTDPVCFPVHVPKELSGHRHAASYASHARARRTCAPHERQSFLDDVDGDAFRGPTGREQMPSTADGYPASRRSSMHRRPSCGRGANAS